MIPVSQSVTDALPIRSRNPALPRSDDPGSGKLRIQTDPPGLQVFLDGKMVGLSPLAALSLAAGSHTYRINAPSGSNSIERTIQIKSAGTAVVDANF